MTFEYELYESKEKGKAEAKLAMVDAMLENGISEEKVAAISGFSKEDILKRKATLVK